MTDEFEDLFGQQTIKWVCPKSKKTFDVSDTEGIAAHKQKMVEAFKLDQELNKKKEQKATLKQREWSAQSLAELQKEFNSVLTQMVPDWVPVELSIFKNEFADFGLEVSLRYTKKDDYSFKPCNPRAKEFLEVLGFGAEHRLGSKFTIFLPVGKNEFLKMLHTWQRTKDKVTLELEKKAFLEKSPEVVELKNKLKTICAQLHALHLEHELINLKYVQAKRLRLKNFDPNIAYFD